MTPLELTTATTSVSQFQLEARLDDVPVNVVGDSVGGGVLAGAKPVVPAASQGTRLVPTELFPDLAPRVVAYPSDPVASAQKAVRIAANLEALLAQSVLRDSASFLTNVLIKANWFLREGLFKEQLVSRQKARAEHEAQAADLRKSADAQKHATWISSIISGFGGIVGLGIGAYMVGAGSKILRGNTPTPKVDADVDLPPRPSSIATDRPDAGVEAPELPVRRSGPDEDVPGAQQPSARGPDAVEDAPETRNRTGSDVDHNEEVPEGAQTRRAPEEDDVAEVTDNRADPAPDGDGSQGPDGNGNPPKKEHGEKAGRDQGLYVIATSASAAIPAIGQLSASGKTSDAKLFDAEAATDAAKAEETKAEEEVFKEMQQSISRTQENFLNELKEYNDTRAARMSVIARA